MHHFVHAANIIGFNFQDKMSIMLKGLELSPLVLKMSNRVVKFVKRVWNTAGDFFMSAQNYAIIFSERILLKAKRYFNK